MTDWCFLVNWAAFSRKNFSTSGFCGHEKSERSDLTASSPMYIDAFSSNKALRLMTTKFLIFYFVLFAKSAAISCGSCSSLIVGSSVFGSFSEASKASTNRFGSDTTKLCVMLDVAMFSTSDQSFRNKFLFFSFIINENQELVNQQSRRADERRKIKKLERIALRMLRDLLKLSFIDH